MVGEVIQYPHTVEIENGNTVLQYKARFELSKHGDRIVDFNSREVLVKGIVYIPLPVADVALGWSAKIYNTLYTGGQTAGIPANVFSFKPSVQIKVGTTVLPGNITFTPGASVITVLDWVGWNIKIERIGQGTLKKDIDYSWNLVTGQLMLLTAGGFQDDEWFDFVFEPRLNGNVIVNQQTIIDLGNVVLYNGTVKQFSRGQLNARLWL